MRHECHQVLKYREVGVLFLSLLYLGAQLAVQRLTTQHTNSDTLCSFTVCVRNCSPNCGNRSGEAAAGNGTPTYKHTSAGSTDGSGYRAEIFS